MSGEPARADAARAIPSIRSRLGNALVIWAVISGVAVGAAEWWASTREVDELLDDALQSSAELLADIVVRETPAGLAAEARAGEPPSGAGTLVRGRQMDRFAWQVVAADGRVLMRSPLAPAEPWVGAPTPGYSDTAQWRVYGVALASPVATLYAAQTRAERSEARWEAALSAVLAAIAVGLIGQAWLRWKVQAELAPLQRLSDRVEGLDLDAPTASATAALGTAQRRELQPMHHALEVLVQRLAARMATEQAVSAHAAHALRTPLAGIDAQLAVALRDCPEALRPRLEASREAARRLQAVVASLISLFRTSNRLDVAEVDLAALLLRLPTLGLRVQVAPGTRAWADADLLSAALANLLDNALRHGATLVRISSAGPGSLRFSDDGPGVTPARRCAMQAALDMQTYDDAMGLGLMLVDRVARAHEGGLRLLDTAAGFSVELALPEPAAREAHSV